MAYTYDKNWLVFYKAEIDQLLELAQTETFSQVIYDTVQEARSAQSFVNNLLATVVLYQPEHAKLRTKIRTWIEYQPGDKWAFNVGKPNKRLRGGPPLMNRGTAIAKARSIAQTSGFQSTEFVFDHTIDSEATWERFKYAFLNIPPTIQQVRIELIRPVTSLEELDIREGWLPELKSPTTVIYRRIA